MGSAAAAHASRQAESEAAAEQKAKEAATSGGAMGIAMTLLLIASPPGMLFMLVSMAQMAFQALTGSMGEKGRDIASMPGKIILGAPEALTKSPSWTREAGSGFRAWVDQKRGVGQDNTAGAEASEASTSAP